jgi:hypothetical protein
MDLSPDVRLQGARIHTGMHLCETHERLETVGRSNEEFTAVAISCTKGKPWSLRVLLLHSLHRNGCVVMGPCPLPLSCAVKEKVGHTFTPHSMIDTLHGLFLTRTGPWGMIVRGLLAGPISWLCTDHCRRLLCFHPKFLPFVRINVPIMKVSNPDSRYCLQLFHEALNLMTRHFWAEKVVQFRCKS